MSYGTALGWLIQSITMSGATSPGDLDPSFDPGSGVEAGALVVQDDGKLIIGGGFTNYNGTAVANIARLNPDGSLFYSAGRIDYLSPSFINNYWVIVVNSGLSGNIAGFCAALAP